MNQQASPDESILVSAKVDNALPPIMLVIDGLEAKGHIDEKELSAIMKLIADAELAEDDLAYVSQALAEILEGREEWAEAAEYLDSIIDDSISQTRADILSPIGALPEIKLELAALRRINLRQPVGYDERVRGSAELVD